MLRMSRAEVGDFVSFGGPGPLEGDTGTFGRLHR